MWAVASAVALATVPDLVGLGARWQGAGGGGTAVVDDGTAAYLNPAGLSRVRRPTAGIGYLHGWPRFAATPPLWWDTNRDGTVDSEDPPFAFDAAPPTMGGLQLQASRNVGGKFGLGFAAYVPARNLIRFDMFDPQLPNYIQYDNRPQRFVAAASVGGQILPGLSVGVGANVLARARMRIAATIAADVSPPAEGEALVPEATIDVHDIDFQVVPAIAPIVGIQFDVGQLVPKLDGLVLGASFHGSAGLPLDVTIDLQANAALTELGSLSPLVAAAVAEAGLALFDHYVPKRLAFGLAYRRAGALTLYADGRFTDWRGYQLNVARLSSASLTSPFLQVDQSAIRDGNPYTMVVRSTFGVRMGTEIALPRIEVDGRLKYVQLFARGGFGYDPTPLVSQGADSALLDSDRMLFSFGTGVEVWDPFALVDGAVRLDLFFQWHVLSQRLLERQTDVPRAGYPIDGPGFPVGGTMPVVGGQWSMEY